LKGNNKLPGYSRHERFDRDLLAIEPDPHLHHDLDEAIEWVLRRAPDRFPCVMGNYRVWRTDKQVILLDHAPMRVLFRYFEAEHEILAIALTKIKPDDDYGKTLWSPPDPFRIDF
jgi:hypothetical protein